jgi:hypothetical protein
MDAASSAAGSRRIFTFRNARNLSIHENKVWK